MAFPVLNEVWLTLPQQQTCVKPFIMIYQTQFRFPIHLFQFSE